MFLVILSKDNVRTNIKLIIGAKRSRMDQISPDIKY